MSTNVRSQHTDSIGVYRLLRYTPVRCDPTLGVQLLNILKGASPGAGGATLLSGEINGEPVVIKAFPTDCPIKYLRGNQRPAISRDYGDFEPGTGLMLTENFIVTSITQNITTCYNLSICEYAYDTPVSVCTRTKIPRQTAYPIPSTEMCQNMREHNKSSPLCPMNDLYQTVDISGYFESPSRSDEVRFMMVERCAGDIQGLIESYDDTTESAIIYMIQTLYKMCIMIFHTLILFDCLLDGYSHKDLGARNVLYTWDPHQKADTYWRYNFPSGTGMIVIDIPTGTFIPKIWDFAYVRFGAAASYIDYYKYLNRNTVETPPRVPDLNNLDGNRENDVYILLTDIDLLLRKVGITNYLFNKLDLNRIRAFRNNTAAIYDFFIQLPIPDILLSDPTHNIIHTFPPENSVFANMNLYRNVMG